MGSQHMSSALLPVFTRESTLIRSSVEAGEFSNLNLYTHLRRGTANNVRRFLKGDLVSRCSALELERKVTSRFSLGVIGIEPRVRHKLMNAVWSEKIAAGMSTKQGSHLSSQKKVGRRNIYSEPNITISQHQPHSDARKVTYVSFFESSNIEPTKHSS